MAIKHTQKKEFEYADENQKNIHKHFSQNNYLSNPTNVDHVYLWTTFFRRNLHRFAMDYLKLKLYPYQQLILYMMGVNPFIVIIASRAAAKSFIIAIWACCRCILYPGSQIVLSSATRGQSKLIVSEKIKGFLLHKSNALRKEIASIKDAQNEVKVIFRNGSTITVVTADESGRGNRSTGIVREEFRQIQKKIEDSILSPFQVVRQQDYMFLKPYCDGKEFEERPIDIYISSSWLDDGHWMWDIVDKSFIETLNNEPSCLLAFDESIVLKHRIKSLDYLIGEKKKQDPLTWRIEFLNERVKENTHAFFTYQMLAKNQKSKQVFYPRTHMDFRSRKKNPYGIPKQPDEIRVINCDMAFVENTKNDNSSFTCMRLLPETIVYNIDSQSSVEITQGYRRLFPYMEALQGGDTFKQALRIRQLFEDFKSDYIVLDLRNAGISIYDLLAKTMYDEERGCEYTPLSCMNDEKVANRIKVPNANPCIFVIQASQKLNSDIALNMQRVLTESRVEFLVNYNIAAEEILPKVPEYLTAPDADTNLFYETPFLEVQELFNEMTSLTYEKKKETGAIVVSEHGSNRKDRYTSVSYGNYFASLLELDLLSSNTDYDFDFEDE